MLEVEHFLLFLMLQSTLWRYQLLFSYILYKTISYIFTFESVISLVLMLYMITLFVCMVECSWIVPSCTIQEERDSDSQTC